MLIDWPRSFGEYLDRLDREVESGSAQSRLVRSRVLAELEVLQELAGEPGEESATLKRVRQHGRYEVWRVAHPYHAQTAVRLIAWFPPDQTDRAVVALFAGDKAQMGDVFYNSVGSRADTAIEQWKYQQREQDRR